MSFSPHILRGQVISHDPENDSMFIQLSSGQMLGYPVPRLYAVSDGLRLSKKPLPPRGSWVALGLMGGDIRSAMVLGSYHPNQVDAIPNGPGDAFSDYESHYSGHWHHLDGVSGHYATQFADRSYLMIGSGSALPTIFRHKVDENQKRQRVPFTDDERNPKPQQPFGVHFQQAVSGTMGGFAFNLDVSGNVSLTQMATGKTFTVHFGNATVTVDGQSNVSIDVGAGKNLNLTQGGSSASDFLTLVSKLVSAFNGHTHSGVEPGGGDTGTPTSPWNNNTVRSAMIGISN